ncbi:hypothetical protein Hanom_Chr10g00932481 [Helianthus anomalus]
MVFIAKLAASAESSSHVGSFVICSVEDEFMNNDVFSPLILDQSFRLFKTIHILYVNY